ncbi:hypothetical protein WJX73_004114 [Symbiochloris irregularis]|uniref:Uncharacterized protein n=1 Tax=Symbiochloris irregularis TaxID=706552 RepID=A0AAW1NTZ4_9CHLO
MRLASQNQRALVSTPRSWQPAVLRTGLGRAPLHFARPRAPRRLLVCKARQQYSEVGLEDLESKLQLPAVGMVPQAAPAHKHFFDTTAVDIVLEALEDIASFTDVGHSPPRRVMPYPCFEAQAGGGKTALMNYLVAACKDRIASRGADLPSAKRVLVEDAEMLTCIHINFSGTNDYTDRLTPEDAALLPSQQLGLRVLSHCKFGCHVAKLRRLMREKKLSLNPEGMLLECVLKHLHTQQPDGRIWTLIVTLDEFQLVTEQAEAIDKQAERRLVLPAMLSQAFIYNLASVCSSDVGSRDPLVQQLQMNLLPVFAGTSLGVLCRSAGLKLRCNPYSLRPLQEDDCVEVVKDFLQQRGDPAEQCWSDLGPALGRFLGSGSGAQGSKCFRGLLTENGFVPGIVLDLLAKFMHTNAQMRERIAAQCRTAVPDAADMEQIADTLQDKVDATLANFRGEVDAMGGAEAVTDLLLLALTGGETLRSQPLGNQGMTIWDAAAGGFFTMREGSIGGRSSVFVGIDLVVSRMRRYGLAVADSCRHRYDGMEIMYLLPWCLVVPPPQVELAPAQLCRMWKSLLLPTHKQAVSSWNGAATIAVTELSDADARGSNSKPFTTLLLSPGLVLVLHGLSGEACPAFDLVTVYGVRGGSPLLAFHSAQARNPGTFNVASAINDKSHKQARQLIRDQGKELGFKPIFLYVSTGSDEDLEQILSEAIQAIAKRL